MPEDYQTWYETMCAKFPPKFSRLFQGPMWSGLSLNLQKDPLTVSMIFYDTLIFVPLFSCIIISVMNIMRLLSHTINNMVLFCYA